MSASKLQFGIIGAGRIGRVHAETLSFRLPHTSVRAIADTDCKAARSLAERCNIAIIAESAEQMMADSAIDAIVICSPTGTHADLMVKAAQAGKHIFCEKPISLCLESIDRALKVVDASGVCLQIGFNRRFDSNFRRVRDAVASGEIGVPSLMHIISRDPDPPSAAYVRTSGGIFMDMTIHDFDMARFLMGDEVEEIYTAAGVMIDPEIGKAGDLDTAVVVLRFRGGAIATIDNSRKAAYGYDQRVEILGSLGKIETKNRYPNQACISTARSVSRDLPLNFFMDRYEQSFVAELDSFAAAILEGHATAVPGSDGRITTVMALAARKSYDERRPVRIEEVSG